MSETDNRKEGTDPLEGTGEAKMEKITLDVGYDGWSSNDTRPVRFTGRKVAGTSNHSFQGPDLRNHGLDEGLPAEAGIDGHDQHLVHLV